MDRRRLLGTVGFLATGAALGVSADDARNELVVVVMDPLAFPLSCPCVKGYAQRDYDRLAVHLSEKLGKKVRLAFAESLKTVVEQKTGGRADLVIGKRSVVEFDANRLELPLLPVAVLSGKDGATTQNGFFVVRSADPARTVADLKGYRIIFGPNYCDEKHAAALALLKMHGVSTPAKLETTESCSDGVLQVLEAGPNVRGAPVISSYAKPLLEGCGTIQKGDLRVIGETAPVPFVTAFVNSRLEAGLRSRMRNVLLDVGASDGLRAALETKAGFVQLPGDEAISESPSLGSKPQPWSGWRGHQRNGLTSSLPETLSKAPTFLWRKPLREPSQAGLAVDEKYLVVADRERADDVYRCLSAATGDEVWTVRYPAAGNLDYGNAPRATPLIHDGLAFLYGAFGLLHCVEMESGKVRWKKNLRTEFLARDKLVWGATSSPLVAQGKLIVNPGGADASLVSLDPATGEVLWKTPGEPAAFASFVAADIGGKQQLVGYDQKSLGGWDVVTGRRLWKLVPPIEGDFNVPTPVVVGRQLLLASENNGTRLYEFDAAGRIISEPVGANSDLAPDSHTPVVIGRRVFGVWGGLHCLDLNRRLKPIWTANNPAFEQYATIIGSPERILITSQAGELVLVDALADEFRELGRMRVFGEDAGVYSHPALVGDKLYLRGSSEICCVQL